jgi:citrate synthase
MSEVKNTGWGTIITKVMPNNLIISGYPLQEIIGRKSLLEVAYLLTKQEFPDEKTLEEMKILAVEAIKIPAPVVKHIKGEDISKTLVKYMVLDEALSEFPDKGTDGAVRKTVFCLGRTVRYFSAMLGTESVLKQIYENESFTNIIYRALTGNSKVVESRARLIEAMIVASVDHGVTPPSAQATIIAASTRTPFEVAVGAGAGVITDVHGGAGANAARLFKECIIQSKERKSDLAEAARNTLKEYLKTGKRIEGLGHRVHTLDPRRDVLWNLAAEAGVAGDHVAVSKIVSAAFQDVKGINLPINVDGVIGAIVADMELDPVMAKILFVFGRVAGMSAHYFEEVTSQPPMRQINFAEAVYKGKDLRKVP